MSCYIFYDKNKIIERIKNCKILKSKTLPLCDGRSIYID